MSTNSPTTPAPTIVIEDSQYALIFVAVVIAIFILLATVTCVCKLHHDAKLSQKLKIQLLKETPTTAEEKRNWVKRWRQLQKSTMMGNLGDAVVESIVDDPVAAKFDHFLYQTNLGRVSVEASMELVDTFILMLGMIFSFVATITLQFYVTQYILVQNRLMAYVFILASTAVVIFAMKMLSGIAKKYTYARKGGSGLLSDEEVRVLVEPKEVLPVA